MVEFEEFLDDALMMGKGRIVGTLRQLPVFVPEGNYQDELFEKTLDYLVSAGFALLDVRNKSYEAAIGMLNLNWPVLINKWQGEEFKADIVESESRLLIVCGKESHPLFYKYLCKESLLYTGGALPPIQYLSPRCYVIPDRACVAALVKYRDFFDNYPLHYFGAVGRFNSNFVPFTL